MKLKPAITVLCASGIVVGLLGSPVGPAVAAEDITKPTLRLPKTAAPVLGSQLGVGYQDESDYAAPVDLVTSWSASDASGICGYRVSEWGNFTADYMGFDAPWTWDTSFADTQYANSADQYSPWGRKVRVRDCAGNKRTKFVVIDPRLVQEDGTLGKGGIGPFEVLDVTRTGTWGTSNCACWSDGTTTRSSQAGARLDFTGTFDYPWSSTPPTVSVGLVMETAPDRGKVQILVDGELQAVVDTGAPAARHRVVVWVGSIPTGGEHTLSIVNLGTPGRPRIDVDALVVS